MMRAVGLEAADILIPNVFKWKKATEMKDSEVKYDGRSVFSATLVKWVEEINIHANAATHIEKSERHDENRKLIFT